MTKLFKFLTFLVSVILLIILIVDLVIENNKQFKPSKEFYINDRIDVLLSSTSHFIYKNGSFYYEQTMNDENIESSNRGVQIVVFTYDISESFNTTDIFNNYGVGSNDLGMMIFMGFEKVNDEYEFRNLNYEIGIKLSHYLTIFETTFIKEEHFDNYGSSYDYDSKIFNFYYKLIEVTANKIYNYSSLDVERIVYTTDEYLEEQFEYYPRLPKNLFELTTKQIILIIFVVIFLFGSFGPELLFLILANAGVKTNRGGGGKSRGYKI